MASWLSLTGGTWFPLFEGSQELADYRLAHLGSPRDPPLPLAQPGYIFLHPSDGGPPCRLRDLQLFRIWVDRRRTGPRPGIKSALDLFNQPPDGAPYEKYSPAVWRRAVVGVRGMHNGLIAIWFMAEDAEIEGRISLVHIMDLVWFLARSAFIITWMNADRADRADTTVVLPIMPLCLEVLKMATNCISMDQGLPAKVALTLMTGMLAAVKEVKVATHRDGLYCDLAADDSDADEESHPTPLF
jgi:hypothetical protein